MNSATNPANTNLYALAARCGVTVEDTSTATEQAYTLTDRLDGRNLGDIILMQSPDTNVWAWEHVQHGCLTGLYGGTPYNVLSQIMDSAYA